MCCLRDLARESFWYFKFIKVPRKSLKKVISYHKRASCAEEDNVTVLSISEQVFNGLRLRSQWVALCPSISWVSVQSFSLRLEFGMDSMVCLLLSVFSFSSIFIYPNVKYLQKKNSNSYSRVIQKTILFVFYIYSKKTTPSCIYRWFALPQHTLHFDSRCKCGPGDMELTTSSAEGQATSPQPAALPLAPSNQVNGIHFTDVIKKINYHKLVIYHPHEDYRPCPGTSPSLAKCVSPSPSHTALSVCQHYLWMNPAIYLALTHTFRQSHSQSFVRASGPSNKSPVFGSQREWGKGGLFSVIRFSSGWKLPCTFQMFSTVQRRVMLFSNVCRRPGFHSTSTVTTK